MNPSSPPRLASLAPLLACAAVVIATIGMVVARDSPEPVVAATTTSTTSTTMAPTTTTVPPPVVPVSTNLASPKGQIAAYDAPGGAPIGKVGLWYGYPMTMPILEEQGTWLRIMMPERPNGMSAWVQAAAARLADVVDRGLARMDELGCEPRSSVDEVRA